MRYYIADTHFFHRNLNHAMDNRGFADEYEMNEYMIEKWNSKVRDKDEVVILGDFSLGNAKETSEVLERLKGRLYLIVGNHDKYLDYRKFDRDRFQWIKNYEELHDNKRKIILSHYPIFCYNGQYRTDQEGNPRAYMLYGHVHNTYDEVLVNRFLNITRESDKKDMYSEEIKKIPCNMINCFCMFSDYTPLSLDEWIELDAIRRAEMSNK